MTTIDRKRVLGLVYVAGILFLSTRWPATGSSLLLGILMLGYALPLLLPNRLGIRPNQSILFAALNSGGFLVALLAIRPLDEIFLAFSGFMAISYGAEAVNEWRSRA